MSSTHRSKIRYLKVFAQKQQEITKEVVEFHVLLTRSLFGGGIPRRLLLRVSLAKQISAPLRF